LPKALKLPRKFPAPLQSLLLRLLPVEKFLLLKPLLLKHQRLLLQRPQLLLPRKRLPLLPRKPLLALLLK
jgi:hypothetical protein